MIPNAPSELTAVAEGGYTKILLVWVDNSNDETGFKVYRSTDAVSFSLIHTTGANVTHYEDSGLTRGQIYYYYIKATNADGDSDTSNVASATIFSLSNITLYADYNANVGVYQDTGITPVSASNDPVGQVQDQSGNGRHISQATAGAKPSYQINQVNSLPSIRHASGDILKAATASNWTFLHNGTQFAVYVVWKVPNINADMAFVDTGALSSLDRGFGSWVATGRKINVRIGKAINNNYEAEITTYSESVSNNQWHITAIRRSASLLEVNDDGHWGAYGSNIPDGTPSSSAPTSALTVGGRYDNTFNLIGDWARILIVSGSVSDANHEKIQQFLGETYGLKTLQFFNTPSVVTSDNENNSFGSMVIADNGNFIIAYRKGSSHTSTDGDIYTRISTDQGTTWGSENIILTSASWDYRYAGLSKMSDGSLVMLVGRRTSAPADVTNGVTIITSIDNGASWSSEVVITTNFTSWAREGGRIIELANGDLLCPMYGRDTGNTFTSSRVSRSTDGGATWAHLGVIGNGQANSLDYNEPGIVQLEDGSIIALIRVISTAVYKSVSTDNGSTWSVPTLVLDFAEGLQNPTLLSDGSIVAICRVTTSLDTICIFSADNGSTWQIGYTFPDSPEGPAMVYGNLVQDENGLLYVFYATEASDESDAANMFTKTSWDFESRTVLLDTLSLIPSIEDLSISAQITILLDSLTLVSTLEDLTSVQVIVSMILDSLTLVSSTENLTVLTTILMDSLSLISSLQALEIVPGTISVIFDTLNLTGSVEDLSVNSFVNLSLDNLLLSSSAEDLILNALSSILLDELALESSIQDLTVVPGSISIILDEISLASSVSNLSVLIELFVNLNVLVLSSTPGSLVIIPGDTSLSLDALILSSVAQNLQANTAASINLSTLDITSVTQDLVLSPGGVTLSLDTLSLSSSVEDLVIISSVMVIMDTLNLSSSIEDLALTPGGISVTLEELTLASSILDLSLGAQAAILQVLFKGMFKGMFKN